MKHNLKTIAPAVAVSTLFLLGCEEDVAKPDCTGDEALLGGSWQLLKEDDVTTQGQIYINDSGEEYTYALVYTFECGGDFKNGRFFHILIIHKILSMIYMKVLGSLIQQMKLSLSAGRMDMKTVMSGRLKLMLLVKLY